MEDILVDIHTWCTFKQYPSQNEIIVWPSVGPTQRLFIDPMLEPMLDQPHRKLAQSWFQIPSIAQSEKLFSYICQSLCCYICILTNIFPALFQLSPVLVELHTSLQAHQPIASQPYFNILQLSPNLPQRWPNFNFIIHIGISASCLLFVTHILHEMKPCLLIKEEK